MKCKFMQNGYEMLGVSNVFGGRALVTIILVNLGSQSTKNVPREKKG